MAMTSEKKRFAWFLFWTVMTAVTALTAAWDAAKHQPNMAFLQLALFAVCAFMTYRTRRK